jgi:aminobenzoyl-glutamate utilization protein A
MDIQQLTSFRREIHRNPEPAFTEVGAAARIERALTGLPVQVTTGPAAHDLSRVVNYPTSETVEAWTALAIESGVSPERTAYFRDNGTALVVDLEGNRRVPAGGSGST